MFDGGASTRRTRPDSMHIGNVSPPDYDHAGKVDGTAPPLSDQHDWPRYNDPAFPARPAFAGFVCGTDKSEGNVSGFQGDRLSQLFNERLWRC